MNLLTPCVCVFSGCLVHLIVDIEFLRPGVMSVAHILFVNSVYLSYSNPDFRILSGGRSKKFRNI
jgi:hypothetical protein